MTLFLKKKSIYFFTSMLLLIGQTSSAQLVINELLVNPVGVDNPFEYIEIRGEAGSSLNQIYLCAFEGDSASVGNCDLSISLQGATLGSNGLLFIGTTIGYPNLPQETNVINDLIFVTPDGYLENGSCTFALIFSPVAIEEDIDYDTDNDGTLDLPFGASLVDAVGWRVDTNPEATVYGGVILTQSAGTPDAAIRFYDNTTPFSKPAWYNGDLVDLVNFDFDETSDNFPFAEDTGMTPGDHNIPNDGVGFNQLSEKSFSLFPNPAQEFVDIISETAFESYSIYSISGQLTTSNVLIQNSRIHLADFPQGVYILELRSSDSSIMRKKLIVQ